MGVIPILLIVSVTVAGGFLLAFLWAARNGQFDDLQSPAIRMLQKTAKPKSKNDMCDTAKELMNKSVNNIQGPK